MYHDHYTVWNRQSWIGIIQRLRGTRAGCSMLWSFALLTNNIGMRKSVSSRIRITKRGKLIRRTMAQDHFRINKTGKQIRRKRRTAQLGGKNIKIFKKYLRTNIWPGSENSICPRPAFGVGARIWNYRQYIANQQYLCKSHSIIKIINRISTT